MKSKKSKSPVEKLSLLIDFTGVLTWIALPFILASSLRDTIYFLAYTITWLPAGLFFGLSGWILKKEQRRKSMMCYKDMTFCKTEDCKHFKYCRSAYTEEVQKGAEKWWGSKEAPIAFYNDAPDCYEKSNPNEVGK